MAGLVYHQAPTMEARVSLAEEIDLLTDDVEEAVESAKILRDAEAVVDATAFEAIGLLIDAHVAVAAHGHPSAKVMARLIVLKQETAQNAKFLFEVLPDRVMDLAIALYQFRAFGKQIPSLVAEWDRATHLTGQLADILSQAVDAGQNDLLSLSPEANSEWFDYADNLVTEVYEVLDKVAHAPETRQYENEMPKDIGGLAKELADLELTPTLMRLSDLRKNIAILGGKY